MTEMNSILVYRVIGVVVGLAMISVVVRLLGQSLKAGLVLIAIALLGLAGFAAYFMSRSGRQKSELSVVIEQHQALETQQQMINQERVRNEFEAVQRMAERQQAAARERQQAIDNVRQQTICFVRPSIDMTMFPSRAMHGRETTVPSNTTIEVLAKENTTRGNTVLFHVRPQLGTDSANIQEGYMFLPTNWLQGACPEEFHPPRRTSLEL